jgi:hypothetical protein
MAQPSENSSATRAAKDIAMPAQNTGSACWPSSARISAGRVRIQAASRGTPCAIR